MKIKKMKIEDLEQEIKEFEGFNVRFKCDGRDLRGDKTGLFPYPYLRAAKKKMTVGEYREKRIKPRFPEYQLDVLDKDGKPVPGQTMLSTVRDGYRD